MNNRPGGKWVPVGARKPRRVVCGARPSCSRLKLSLQVTWPQAISLIGAFLQRKSCFIPSPYYRSCNLSFSPEVNAIVRLMSAHPASVRRFTSLGINGAKERIRTRRQIPFLSGGRLSKRTDWWGDLSLKKTCPSSYSSICHWDQRQTGSAMCSSVSDWESNCCEGENRKETLISSLWGHLSGLESSMGSENLSKVGSRGK